MRPSEGTELFRVLVMQHREVDSLLERMAATEDTDTEKRAALFTAMRLKLLSHATAEERTIYAALRAAGDKKETKHATHEHREIEDALQELEACACGDDDWSDRLAKLAKCVHHHVKEEESEIFDSARECMNELELDDMAQRFLTQQKLELAALGVDDGFEELTKQELLEESRDRDIPGRSSMSKDELISHLRGDAT